MQNLTNIEINKILGAGLVANSSNLYCSCEELFMPKGCGFMIPMSMEQLSSDFIHTDVKWWGVGHEVCRAFGIEKIARSGKLPHDGFWQHKKESFLYEGRPYNCSLVITK
jgi:hypothetical protein